MSFDREHFEEQLAERAQEYDDDTAEEFGRWLLTKEGQDAFLDFKHSVIGVPDKVEELDNERMNVLFDFIMSQGKHDSHWIQHYVQVYGDYEGQRGDYLMDKERDQ